MSDFKQVWKELDAPGKRAMARRLLTSYAYLSQIANGHRQAGKHLKIALLRDIEDLQKYAA